MHFIMEIGLVLAMLLSLIAAAWACLDTWQGQIGTVKWLEKGQVAVSSLIVLASGILWTALMSRDFSFKYVSQYTNLNLPDFYAVTAFWAGRSGSLLFWLLIVTVSGAIFLGTKKYRELPEQTKVAFWLLFFTIQGFFLFLLTGLSQPYIQLSPIPADGEGLNPLLQNPGMAFHPPLLFFGYGLLTIPACLSLAMALTKGQDSWMLLTRGWVLPAWAFLSAGIILGGWWAYMELGWGGYWAWDPVENASIIPWFAATAYLHTSILGQRYGIFKRINIVLINLAFLLCIVGTYIVRSGIIESVHAFGGGGVGGPLLVFILGYLFLTLVGARDANTDNTARLDMNAFSRQGLLVFSIWIFLALGSVILLGTMWPVISLGWESNPVGVTAGFYNTVTMPLFVIMGLLLLVCPWFSWKEGVQWRSRLGISILSALCLGVAAYIGGIRMILPLVGFSAGAGVVISIVMLALQKNALASKRFWIAHGTHLGIALMILGVAISGPYQQKKEIVVAEGQSFTFAGYDFEYKGIVRSESRGVKSNAAHIIVRHQGKEIGTLEPSQLIFSNNDHPHTEVSTLFSLGKELYATIHDVNNGQLEPLIVNVNPLINWIWVGGTLVCLFPFIVLLPKRKRKPHTADTE
ncbi:MAG: cytochrome C biogenesis protein CcmF [Desulfovibrio sp.]|mgnify:CR=1 FL=1|nr:cytochrome C biogenesis protein CcmF [Desulfovibrio sp.]|tara:strand:- start:1220 stop:3121 length:1902 start_codon:yes stop_codon:yes gene_type:complete